MGENSAIEWTDTTWNPTVGCTWASPGCDHCYAVSMTRRLEGAAKGAIGQGSLRRYAADYVSLTTWKHFNGTVRALEHRLDDPLRWKNPRMVFVNSMSDLFHKDVPFEFLNRVFEVMENTPQHTYQILTKRPEWMAEYTGWRWGPREDGPGSRIPARNIWLGTSVEDQPRADERVPHLLRCPARVRFLSCEPLLGPIDLQSIGRNADGWSAINALTGERRAEQGPTTRVTDGSRIDWVIVGGESGNNARPMHPDWARSMRDQCGAAGVPFFFKQWGEWGFPRTTKPGATGRFTIIHDTSVEVKEYPRSFNRFGAAVLERVGKRAAGRLLDGREWNEFPTTEGVQGAPQNY